MRESDFIVELEDIELASENDLLRHEVSFLKGRVHYLDDMLKTARAEQAQWTSSSRADDQTTRQVVRETAAERDAALKDLRWVLRKLDRPPLGWVLRRRSGFKRLWAQWVDSSGAK